MLTWYTIASIVAIDCSLIALDIICEGNLNIKEEKLVENLHLAVMEMFDDGLISSLQSCLQETIRNAMHRFADLGLAELKTYPTQNGSYMSFISSPFSKIKDIQQALDLFISTTQITPRTIEEIE